MRFRRPHVTLLLVSLATVSMGACTGRKPSGGHRSNAKESSGPFAVGSNLGGFTTVPLTLPPIKIATGAQGVKACIGVKLGALVHNETIDHFAICTGDARKGQLPFYTGDGASGDRNEPLYMGLVRFRDLSVAAPDLGALRPAKSDQYLAVSIRSSKDRYIVGCTGVLRGTRLTRAKDFSEIAFAAAQKRPQCKGVWFADPSDLTKVGVDLPAGKYATFRLQQIR